MPVLLQEGRLLHARKACSQIQKGPFFFFNTHALHSCGAKQFYIKIKYSSPSHAFHSPTHFPSSPNPHPSHPHSTHLPFPAHSPSAPIPLTFCPQPALFLSPTHSPSVPNPLPVRPQPTLPSPLLTELVHLLPCLLLQATYSPVPSFSCPLATFPCLFSHTTCSLVPPSTRQLTMLLIELVHLLPCLLSHTTCSPVHPSTHQLTMLLIELVHLLPCLFLPPTCSPVPLSPVFLPCQHHLLPPYSALICKLFLSSYFFVGTFPKHCNANSSLFVTHFYRQKRNYQ